eukprot:119620_1
MAASQVRRKSQNHNNPRSLPSNNLKATLRLASRMEMKYISSAFIGLNNESFCKLKAHLPIKHDPNRSPLSTNDEKIIDQFMNICGQNLHKTIDDILTTAMPETDFKSAIQSINLYQQKKRLWLSDKYEKRHKTGILVIFDFDDTIYATEAYKNARAAHKSGQHHYLPHIGAVMEPLRRLLDVFKSENDVVSCCIVTNATLGFVDEIKASYPELRNVLRGIPVFSARSFETELPDRACDWKEIVFAHLMKKHFAAPTRPIIISIGDGWTEWMASKTCFNMVGCKAKDGVLIRIKLIHKPDVNTMAWQMRWMVKFFSQIKYDLIHSVDFYMIYEREKEESIKRRSVGWHAPFVKQTPQSPESQWYAPFVEQYLPGKVIKVGTQLYTIVKQKEQHRFTGVVTVVEGERTTHDETESKMNEFEMVLNPEAVSVVHADYLLVREMFAEILYVCSVCGNGFATCSKRNQHSKMHGPLKCD